MAKKTQLDRAIESIDRDIAILQAAKNRLVVQQTQQKPRSRRPRVVSEAPADRQA